MEQFGPRPLSTNPVISQQFANLRVLDKKEECDVFEGGGGVDTPMHTVSFHFHFISNILENKSQVFERSDCTITVHNDLYYNKLVI